MDPGNPQFFMFTLALVGVVIIIAALLSGLIDKSDVPQVGVFLALGASLGPAGLGLLDVKLDSPILFVVATLSLTLVLFTDAVSLPIAEVRRHARLAFVVLGPGTVLSALLIALAGWYLLDLSPAAAAILGAALASTDPIMLRGLVRRPGLSDNVRLALRLESGLNDVVLLPVILVALPFLSDGSQLGPLDWARLVLDFVLLGPGAGIAVGLLALAALDMIRRKIGVRRDYESLYSLGVAFAAYAAAEAVHGSGFLAAFTAGLTIAALDLDLCDCFLEYGETTAEMALLFAFVLFGSSLIWTGFTVLSWPVVLLAVSVALVRLVAFFAALSTMRIERKECMLIAWFGPRGLSSLLLVLVPVFAGARGSEYLFHVTCFVVLFSVVLHGGSLMFLGRSRGPSRLSEPAPAVDAVSIDHPAQDAPAGGSDDRINIDELKRLRQNGAPVVILDVRSEHSLLDDPRGAEGAIRIPAEHVVRRVGELGVPKNTWLILFCA
jgi:NhaP-type Na+/H+ or K+/H+ antiporter